MDDAVINDIRDRLIRIEEGQKSEIRERKHISDRIVTLEDTIWGPNRDNGLVSSVQTLAVKASLATGIVMVLGNYLIGKMIR